MFPLVSARSLSPQAKSTVQLANKVLLAVGSLCTALTARAWTAKQQSSHQQLF